MPLIETITSKNNTKILIWRIEEEIETLIRLTVLTKKSLERLNDYKNEIHKKQFLGVRQLLQLVNLSDENLKYNEAGKPFLNDNRCLSISHSGIYVAIALSDKNIGIDIEKQNSKIISIQRKFIGKENLFFDEKYKSEFLYIIWSAKESLYKLTDLKGISLKQNIKIHPFKLSDKKALATISKGTYNKIFEIHFCKIENYTLVFAMNV